MNALLQALQPLFEPAFTAFGAPVTWLELVAFVLALAMVLLNIRVNPLAWPLAITSSLLYFALFWNSRRTATRACRSSSRWSPCGAGGSGCAARPPMARRCA